MPNKPKILIIDDDLVILDGLNDLLNEEYEITKAENGRVALDYLKNKTFDLAIIDVMMPEMDGYKLAELILQSEIEVPFIFLTANNEDKSRIKGLELGAEDYICKPVPKEELRLRIKRKLHNVQKISLRNKRLNLIHHNILTPIGVIQGYLGILEGQIKKTDKTILSNQISDSAYMVPSIEWKSFVEQIFDSIDKIGNASAKLINMTKKFIETQVNKNFDINLIKQPVKLKNLLYNAVAVLKPKELKCSISDSLPDILLYVDVEKINQIIYELLDNIVLHNSQQIPFVQINVKIENSKVVFSFTDNARGIKKNDFQNIFNEFWSGYDKLHHTRGEGLGLWICKRYISVHGGDIWVEKSEVNHGSTISFSLPLIDNKAKL